MNTSAFLQRIKTREDAEKLKSEIDVLLDLSYEEKGESFGSSLKSRVRFWVAEILTEELSTPGVNMQEELKILKGEIESLDILTLILSFEPSQSALETLSLFVKKNLGEKIILDVLYDSSILGGAKIIYKGIYRDFSLKKIFDAEFPKIKLDLFRLIAH